MLLDLSQAQVELLSLAVTGVAKGKEDQSKCRLKLRLPLEDGMIGALPVESVIEQASDLVLEQSNKDGNNVIEVNMKQRWDDLTYTFSHPEKFGKGGEVDIIAEVKLTPKVRIIGKKGGDAPTLELVWTMDGYLAFQHIGQLASVVRCEEGLSITTTEVPDPQGDLL